MQAGIFYAAAAHLMWGVFPLYFRALQSIDPLEMLMHRIVWSAGFVALIWIYKREWRWLLDALRQPRVVLIFAASAVLLSLNWFVYIYAVHSGHVVEGSLGYFINPLVNILLGMIFLRERLRNVQWVAILLASFGVFWLTWQVGYFPWIALILALSFGTYGLLRKIAPLATLEGLTLETLLLFPFALACLYWLVYQQHSPQQHSTFVTAAASIQMLLVAAGPITAIPLLCFAAAARRISLATLGVMQYIGPTLQLLIGVWVLDEPFGQARLVGFILIWIALLLYAVEGLWRYRRTINLNH